MGQERGLAKSYWFNARGRKPGTSRDRGGTEDFSGFVYTRDPVTDSRGERENESC